MSSIEAILTDYFFRTRSTLDDVYTWDIPEDIPFGRFERGADSRAQANMRLRRFLSDVWKSSPGQRLKIAKWYVSVWGGIKANKDQTLERYVSLPEENLAGSDLSGVATWSKILALRNPKAYPIYDARVSASLGAIQFANNINNPILFPHVPSRNSAIKRFQEWIKLQPSGSTITVPRSRAYGDYVSLLDIVAKKAGLNSPEAVEMILFANAETLVDQVLTSAMSKG